MPFLIVGLLFFQDLKLPSEIKGQPNQFVTILAETAGEVVRFVAIDPGLSVFPAELLSNKKATVVTGPTGKYRILAYTSVGNKPTDPVITTVVIGDPVAPVPPAPPQPGPNYLSKLNSTLEAIYGALQEPGRESQVKILAQIYKQGALDLARMSNIADVYNGLQSQAAVKMNPQSIVEIRRAISADMKARFGTDANQILNDELRKTFSEYFLSLSSILEGLV
jgi:hypothetical protein